MRPGNALFSLLALFALLPLASAAPDLVASSWGRYVGTIALGERDEAAEWLEAWYPDGVHCTPLLDEVRMTLTLTSASPVDVVRLRAGASTGIMPDEAFATAATPAILVAQNPSRCPLFSIEGTFIRGTARYELRVEPCGTDPTCLAET